MTPHPEITPWFFGTWIALGLVGFWFMYLDRNVTRKKRLLPVFIIGSGVLFVIFGFLVSGSFTALAFMFPAVVLICILNLRMIKVCASCGRTIQSGLWFAKAEYCSKCGARLE